MPHSQVQLEDQLFRRKKQYRLMDVSAKLDSLSRCMFCASLEQFYVDTTFDAYKQIATYTIAVRS